jgi:acyl phosphate:glycerol-3-phosphate acyltransferase
VTGLILRGLISYLLGSIVASLLIGRFRGVDIRTLGSGNAGATNALRTQGKAVGLTVLIIDLAKGWLASAVLAIVPLPLVPPMSAAAAPWSVPVCALAVMLGHVYPVWYGFRGGKGVATLVGVLLGIAPALLLVFVVTFLVTVMLTGYVSLGSMLATLAIAAAVRLGVGHLDPRTPVLAFAIAAFLLIVYTHRSNIARLRAGTESRARRLWLLKRSAA